VIDLHTHLLPGIDDGPATIGESLELARALVGEGVTVAACTPHVRDDHTTTPEAMETALELLRSELSASEIPLDARGGGEIAIDELPRLDPSTRGRYGLGGNARLLLLEFPYYGWPLALGSIVAELAAAGTVVLLAHPERSPEVQEDPRRLAPLVEGGAYVQLTASSLDGGGGPAAARCAHTLLGEGLAQVVASDSHGRTIRRSGLGSVGVSLGDEMLADWLTDGVPAALLAGNPPPPRPYRSGGTRRRRPWRSR
jgi:protein-tyrosine phosphatase